MKRISVTQAVYEVINRLAHQHQTSINKVVETAIWHTYGPMVASGLSKYKYRNAPKTLMPPFPGEDNPPGHVNVSRPVKEDK